ncbi:conserved hypothetical protein [Chromobacterium violaceum ATCC 12472]|uniref:Inner membrane protein yjcH n=2 Tax=Chromobacterium violaceum TaxID=536 RepID=Q7NSY9_CHRVO|nr:conserved hypothetical protein [Chromobacterium violaceum ATCC 12472]
MSGSNVAPEDKRMEDRKFRANIPPQTIVFCTVYQTTIGLTNSQHQKIRLASLRLPLLFFQQRQTSAAPPKEDVMNEETLKKIQSNPKYLELVHKKTSLGWTLAIVMLVIYYGYILVLAFAPSLLGKPLYQGATMTVGIPVGVCIILSAFVLTGIYVRRANQEFDPLTQQIVEEAK